MEKGQSNCQSILGRELVKIMYDCGTLLCVCSRYRLACPPAESANDVYSGSSSHNKPIAKCNKNPAIFCSCLLELQLSRASNAYISGLEFTLALMSLFADQAVRSGFFDKHQAGAWLEQTTIWSQTIFAGFR
jgi:hypothetical protein